MAEIEQVLTVLESMKRGLEAAFGEMDDRLQNSEKLIAELVQQNKKQQRVIEKFMEQPQILARQEIEAHEREYRTAGLRVFLSHFPAMWSDDTLKTDYRKAIVSAGHVRSQELISELASWLWKWAANLRSNLLKTKEPSAFMKAVGNLGDLYTSDAVAKGEADSDIMVILQKYFREAAVTDLPVDFDKLISAKIRCWRLPFIEFASEMKWNMNQVITKWKQEAEAAKAEVDSPEDVDSPPSFNSSHRHRKWFTDNEEGTPRKKSRAEGSLSQ